MFTQELLDCKNASEVEPGASAFLILSSAKMQSCITCTCCSQMFHQITRNVLIMHFGECVGFIEVLPASLNLAVSLRAVGISPDPSADTSSVLFTHSFLLLHARICFILFFSFLRLFLKLPNSCHSSWLKDVALSPVNLNPSLIFGEACGAQSAWPRFFCCFFFKLDFSP